MANLGSTYDASQGDGMEDRNALPAGEYPAQITKSEIRENNKKTGSYIWCEFQVIDGPAANRIFWGMYNLWHEKQNTVEIAQREFNSLCRAAGKLQVTDTNELHGLPLRVKLSVKNDEQFGASNTIKGYKPFNETSSAPPPTGAQTEAGRDAPWKKSA